MSTKGTFQIIAEELTQALRPLKDAVASPASFKSFLRELGWNAGSMPAVYTNLANDVNLLVTSLQAIGPSPTVTDIQNLISNIKALYQSIKNIQNTAGNKPTGVDLNVFLQDAAKQIFEYLLHRYASQEFPKIYQTLVVGGVITKEHHAETTTVSATPETRPFFDEFKFHPDKLGDLISKPSTIPAVVYGWGTPAFDSKKVLANLFELFASMGLSPYMSPLPFDYAANYDLKLTDESDDEWALYLPLFNFVVSGQRQEIGVIISGFHGDENNPSQGIIIQPYLPTSLGTTINLGSNFELNLRAATNIFQLFAIIISADDVDIRFPGQPNTTLPAAGFGATLSYRPPEALTIFGNPLASRLEMQGADLSLFADYLNNSFEIQVDADIKGLAVVLAAGDGDSFINKLLGSGEKRIDIELGINWSNIAGLRFRGSGGFEIELNPHFSLGPITVENLKLALKVLPTSPAKAKVIAAAGLKLALGPFTAIVEEVGLELTTTFAEGNAGPFDIKAGFKPPTGLGLSIKNKTISGAGYLSFNKDDGRYIGALELRIQDVINIKAFGVLNTKLPGGAPGYALILVILTDGFQPIPLGFGFTLNGIGGLIALNRRMDSNFLLNAAMDGSIKNILSPDNPVENINSIVDTLENAFPIEEGRFTFGPMLKIGWGSPTLITIDLGVFLEFPDPEEVVILGLIRAILPSESSPVVNLQIAFVGVINFEQKYISFNAALINSTLLNFPLAGDMVFRLRWGDQPIFVFSVGGFHPQFQVPSNLGIPPMRRMTLNLLDGDNPRLTLTSYFAITSNSVQFGAAIDFYYGLGSIWLVGDIDVVGHLGFDALIYFNPFHFRVNIDGNLAVRRDGDAVLSISLTGMVEGPKRWHVQGTFTFEVFGHEFSKDFDTSWGEPDYTSLPDVQVLPKLTAALQDTANWQTTPVGNVPLLVTLRELVVNPGDLVVHPQTAIAVNQKIVPLNTNISRFGNARPTGITNFKVDISYNINPNLPYLLKTDLKEYFSPNEFFDLSEGERLHRASFEQFPAGLQVSSTSNALTTGGSREMKYLYETIVMDSRNYPIYLPSETPLEEQNQDIFRDGNAASKSVFGSNTFINGDFAPPPVIKAGRSFAVATTGDLTQMGNTTKTQTEAQQELERLLAQNPALEGTLQIVNTFELP